MKKKYKVLSLFFVFVLLLSTVSVQAENNGNNGRFKDVDDKHWAYEYIELMAERKIINGYDDGAFHPNDSVSREQFSKMMVLTLGLDLIKPSKPYFQDVNQSQWSYAYVETARKYLTGFRTAEGDFFRPESNAVREDMAVAIVLGLGLSIENADINILDQFEDKETISDNLRDYVAVAVEEGIMVGSGGKFNPQATLTRAEAATLLARLIEEDKIIYDEEKVIYPEDEISEDVESDEDDVSVSSQTPQLSAKVKDGKVYLDWTRVDERNFVYYKVVASETDQTPAYPENGYVIPIDNVKETDYYIYPYDEVNRDAEGDFTPGKTYYMVITAVYEGNVYNTSNVVSIVMPEAGDKDRDKDRDRDDDKDDDEDDDRDEDISEEDRIPELEISKSSDGLELDWSEVSSSQFVYYKLVFSKSDETPIYPEDGYLVYIKDTKETEYTAVDGQNYNGGDIGGKLESGETYYVSITAVYGNGKKYYPSNTVKVELP